MGPMHYRSGLLGGGDKGGVRARRAVRRLVSKLGGEGSWEASGKLDFLECESSLGVAGVSLVSAASCSGLALAPVTLTVEYEGLSRE